MTTGNQVEVSARTPEVVGRVQCQWLGDRRDRACDYHSSVDGWAV